MLYYSIKVRRTRVPHRGNESGAALLFFAFIITGLISFLAFAIDLAKAIKNEQDMQHATDAAAFAAARIVSDPNLSDSEVLAEAALLAKGNGVQANELSNAGSLELGHWDDSTDTFTAGGTPRNAVRAPSVRAVETNFAGVFGVSSVNPAVFSIAVNDAVANGNCVKPIGFSDQNLELLTPGTVITLHSETPGNWGKIDLLANMSSGPAFADAMLNDYCDTFVSVGDPFSPGTGNGGPIGSIFETLFDSGDVDMIIPVVDGFPNGNNGMVTIVGFADATLVSVSPLGGLKWTADLQINDILTEAPVSYTGDPGIRNLVR